MSEHNTIRKVLLGEKSDRMRKLDQLVRQGMMSSAALPMLHRGLDKLQSGKTLSPTERDAVAKVMDSLMYIVTGDDTVFQKAKMYTCTGHSKALKDCGGGGSICECGRGKHLPAQADKEPVRGVQSRQARTSPCRRISTSFEFEPHLLLPTHTCSVLGCDSLGVIPSQVSQTEEVQGGGLMRCSVYNRLPACAFLILATGTWSQGGRQ